MKRKSIISMISWLGVLLLSLFLHACDQSEPVLTPFIYKNLYKLEIPEMMEPMQNLTTGTDVQFGFARENIYLAILHTPIDSLGKGNPVARLDSLYQFHEYNLLLSLKDEEISEADTLTNASMIGLHNQISGTFQGHAVTYDLCIWEGKTHFYQILMWFPSEDIAKWNSLPPRVYMSLKEIQASRDSLHMP